MKRWWDWICDDFIIDGWYMTWAEFVCWTAIVRQAVDIEIIGIFVSRTLIIVIRILQIFRSKRCVFETQIPLMATKSNEGKNHFDLNPSQGHVMSLKCEQPIDELTVQILVLYDHPNLKYNNAKRSIPAHPTFVNDTHHDLHLWTVTSKINRVYHG